MMGDDDHLDEAGADLQQALAAVSPHQVPAALRERIVRAAAARPRQADRWWLRAPLLAGGATLLVLVGLSLAWGLSVNASLAQERSLRAELQDAAAKDEIVFDVVDARNVNKTTLRSTTDDSPTAPYGKVFVRPDMPYVVAMAGRLPPAPAGQEYHLYLDALRIGAFAPTETGFGYFVYRANAVGIAYQRARIILEPPQATAATGTVVLSWPVP